MRRALPALLLLLSLAGAQVVVYYRFETLAPGRLAFDGRGTAPARLDADRMACGALFDPRPASPQAPYAEVRYPGGPAALASCANPAPYPDPVRLGDPVVALGYDPVSGSHAEGWTLTVRFTSFSRLRFETLYRALARDYRLRLAVDSGTVSADFRVPDGLIAPGTLAAELGGLRWIALADGAELRFTRRPRAVGCFAPPFRTCYRATWALPLQLRVHGDERGNPVLRVAPDGIVQRRVSTQALGGRIARIRVLPEPER